ncbi:hypothetical protein BCR42DRAFT_338859, partial [Absidia repens]
NYHKVSFVPGEEQLHALTAQLRRIGARYDDRYRYKADGVIRVDSMFGLEVVLLETSSGFGHGDQTKASFDFHKAMFGLLAMLKSVADQFEGASLGSFRQFKVYFVHAAGNVCRTWSLKYNNNAYILCREDKVTMHQNFKEKNDFLIPLCNYLNNLKEMIIQSVSHLDVLEDEHKKSNRLSRYGKPINKQLLLSNIITPSILRLTQKYDSGGMADQNPGSSPTYDGIYSTAFD